MSSPRRFEVWGDPIGHSLSPVIHRAAAQILGLELTFERRRVDPTSLADALELLRQGAIDGASVTIPLKERVWAQVDRRTPLAERVGAVNAVRRVVDGDGVILEGNNTDASALRRLVPPSTAGATALILGVGGAGRAAAWALAEAGYHVVLWNRTVDRSRLLESELRQAGMIVSVVDGTTTPSHIWDGLSVVIQATSVGLNAPGACVVRLPPVMDGVWAIDLVYRPLETRFLREARAAGAHTVDGLDVLVGQAVDAIRWWWPEIEVSDELSPVLRDAALRVLAGDGT